MLLVDCSAFISDLCINKEELILKNFFNGFPISVLTGLGKKKKNTRHFYGVGFLESWRKSVFQKPLKLNKKFSRFNPIKYFTFIIFPKCLKSLEINYNCVASCLIYRNELLLL